MNDDSFARLVAEEIKNKVSDQQREYLKLPENWGRWQRAVSILLKNLDNQVEEIIKGEQQDVATYQALGSEGITLIAEVVSDSAERRKKIDRFRFHVAHRLDEITRMIAMSTDQVEERMKTVEFLRRAIKSHKDLMYEYDLEETAIDTALWAALDGYWTFDDIDEHSILG